MEAKLINNSYILRIHCYPKRIKLLPNPDLCRDNKYFLSEEMSHLAGSIISLHKPRIIGDISERVVMELLDGGSIFLDGNNMQLTCRRLREIFSENVIEWKPKYGIRCDDLAAFNRNQDGELLLFPTECKGTNKETGLSRNEEAKMFYQIARTYEKIKKSLIAETRILLGGVISAIVNHYSKIITININDNSTNLSGGLPDS